MGPLQCLGAQPLFSPPPAERDRPFVHFAPRHSLTCTCGPSVLKLQHLLLSLHQSYFSASRVRKIQPAAPDSTPESWSLGWYLPSALRQARSSLPPFPCPRQAKKGWLPRHGMNFLGPPDHTISEQLAARVPPHYPDPEISNCQDTLLVRPCCTPLPNFRMAAAPALPNGFKPQSALMRVSRRPEALSPFTPTEM